MSDKEELNLEVNDQITDAVTEGVIEEGNADTIAAKPTGISRSDLLAKMVAYASKMDKDSLAQAVETITKSPDEIYNTVTGNTTGDASGKNKASIKSSGAKGDAMASVKEDLALLFGDSSDLSEDFRLKTEALFEAAVSTRVNIEVARLEEEYEARVDESVEEVKNDMVENIDKYLNVAVAEWIAENQLAVRSSIRTQMAESFLTGLKSLFEDHYVDIPEETTDIVESLTSELDTLRAQVAEIASQKEELEAVVNESRIKETVDALSEGMTDTQRDKFGKLIEAINYSDAEEFRKKAAVIKETYFSGKSEVKVVEDQLLSETVEEEPAKPASTLNPEMQMYVSSLSKSIKR